MNKLSTLAIAAALLVCAPTGFLFAQTTAADRSAATENGAGAKKSDTKPSRRREVDKSVESGTVPSRYRKDVPKEYQKYIPWAK